MKSVGIIAEYNPIHSGHKYHLEQSRQTTGADCVTVIMSGNFVQRGEPAILNKYTRARCALVEGADLVIELPCAHALSSAEQFAAGAVDILSALNIDFLSFGSESGQLEDLQKIASLLAFESEPYQNALRQGLADGLSFPAARMAALTGLMPEAGELLNSPNNILGLEYLKQILRKNYSIQPVTVKRMGSGYHEQNVSPGSFPSASALRTLLESNTPDALKEFVSPAVFSILSEAFHKTFPIYADDFSALLYYRIAVLLLENQPLTDFSDISGPLANKISKNLSSGTTFTEFANSLKSRDLTHTRIMRSLMHILLNQKTASAPNHYVRILGFNETGQKFLSSVKKKCPIPIITKPAAFKELLTADLFAASLYNQVVFEKYGHRIADDLTHPIVRV